MAQFVMDAKAIKAKIASISKRSNTLKSDIDHVARCTLLHAVVHGDVTLADDLTKAMGDGWRLNALRAWFGAMGPFGWAAKDKATKRDAHFTLNKDKRNAMLAEYKADDKAFIAKLSGLKSYWEFKPEAEFEGFDLDKELKKLLARAKSKANTDKYPDQSKVNLSALPKLEQLVAGTIH